MFTARLIFDLSFFIIVTTIGLNIVFGIIVDTFSELREERVSLLNLVLFYKMCFRIILKPTRKASALYVIFLAMILKGELKYVQFLLYCFLSLSPSLIFKTVYPIPLIPLLFRGFLST